MLNFIKFSVFLFETCSKIIIMANGVIPVGGMCLK